MQIPHPFNYDFLGQKNQSTKCTSVDEGVFRLLLDESLVEDDLQLPVDYVQSKETKLEFENSLRLIDAKGNVWLESSGPFFGRNGDSWVMCFDESPDMRFYGLGQKCGDLNKRGLRTKMWNVDVWGEHSLIAVKNDAVDPMYVSIPWLIIERTLPNGQKGAMGIFIRNSRETFFSLAPEMRLHPSQEPITSDLVHVQSLYMGAIDGPAEVWVLFQPTVELLAERFSKLIGTMPCPEPWVLGNHQCRWGYKGIQDLQELHEGFINAEIPCDGLWLDIDYMDSYRVFTLSPEYMQNAEDHLKALRKLGRRVVAILDPGVKEDPHYEVYQDGIENDIFCHNSIGKYYRGIVWPGVTVYPDFSLPQGQVWWSKNVKNLALKGFAGFWIDMNDPSTGSIPCKEMLFQKGKKSHQYFHNQYANAMAKATIKGLQQAFVEQSIVEKPFVLTRSANTGIARYAGVWLGDNFSNWFHLQQSIPMALNMSMSGVPLVGADIPGFGGAVEPELMERWVAAHFLFPFFRNHSAKDAPRQEPWQFSEATQNNVAKWVRLRYRLIPYLLQVFREHEQTGALILRPYFFEDSSESAYLIQDQFFVGKHILVAPILTPNTIIRKVQIPAGQWKLGLDGSVFEGNATYELPCPSGDLLWFTRVGAKIPVLKDAPKISTDEVLSEIESLLRH